ncbi:MAG: nucleotidyltransferase domain-containing protein [Deltaproteobacteria bacterium]|nr:nucleotidyltransferase domain-containing protein [Deltaproteobacteria bacterium]
MLGPKEILGELQARKNEMRSRFSVMRIGLFGSHLRGTASEISDIDLVVDLDEPTFDHYMDLKFYLEAIFEKPVDLVLSDTVKPRLRPVIHKEVAYA